MKIYEITKLPIVIKEVEYRLANGNTKSMIITEVGKQ